MSVILRSPDKTTYQFQSFVMVIRTKGGTLLQSRPYAFTTDIITWEFSGLSKTQVDTALSYMYSKAGEKIHIQDEQGRIWFGIILSKVKVWETHANKSETSDCSLWAMSFEFEGDLM